MEKGEKRNRFREEGIKIIGENRKEEKEFNKVLKPWKLKQKFKEKTYMVNI